jgi:hypothetical protein
MGRNVASQRKAMDRCYRTVADPARGDKPGERGAELSKNGYRPGRKTAGRRHGKRGIGVNLREIVASFDQTISRKTRVFQVLRP